ncbi:hypothetical protein [Bdellovibrio sp. HCB288]|uniref:hypothetical protein n=1 Tax=Bdellovibrio sp. HCB288 TaxID=3394355 RepID=UPI0039B438FE
MILAMFVTGILSAFALGPASFSIIRSLVSRRSWPWSSIAGFLLGDLIYILFATALLRSPLLHLQWFKNLLTVLTALALLIFSVHVIFSKSPTSSIQIPDLGFRMSLALTLSNFHLVFIYAGLFSHALETNTLLLGVSIYALTFVASFMALLWSLKRLHGPIKKILRKIEVVAACGFFCFSVYLSMEIL